ncbi:RNA metabolism protein [Lithospermum erythrorhizon]|uniref:YTH domain-containing family protein n=1 Tax=Lithospermum erythrorhizon TaxID=34254 RepID=A0AAV3RXB8_LITER
MASVAPPSDRILTSSANSLEAAEMLQKLSLDSTKKTFQPESTKKNSVGCSPVDAVGNGVNMPMERSLSPFMDPNMFYNPNGSSFMDPSMFYNPSGYPSPTYYYGGNEWDGYVNSEGVEMQAGVYGDYQQNYGYMPYGYSPSGSTVGHDGQMYGAQQYQYPTSYYQPSTTTPTQSTSQAELTNSFGTNQSQLPIDTTKGNQYNAGNVMTNQTNFQKPLVPNNLNSAKNNEFYRSGVLSTGSGISAGALQGTHATSGRNQNQRPYSHLMGSHYSRSTSGFGQSGYMNQIYPNNRAYGQYTSAYRSGPGLMSSSYYPRITGNGLFGVGNRYKSRSRTGYGYNKESIDGLNELNKGPRSKSLKDQNDSKPITLAVKGQSLPSREISVVDNLLLSPDREQYNKEDFPETYSNAKFFVIKSYSEDDVHKSIKYGVWTSTPNGNKKLDAAYKEAKENSDGSPLFLLFSVNGSGQFVGLAEMVGPVDFDKTVEYWQQDKWSGCFPVKWHMVKDLPNSCLRHITLENNENKPVTNSRDTQEVRLEQGLEILKIYKSYSSQTCILDDFDFYEGRQKVMQEKKSRQRQTNMQVGALNLFGGESTENGEREIPKKSNDLDQKSSETSVSPGSKATNGEVKLPGENVSILTRKDTSNGPQSEVSENNLIPNGITKIT